MSRFVFVSLLLLAWVFYEASGGADFVPPSELAKVQTQADDTTANTAAKPPAVDAAEPAPPRPEPSAPIIATAPNPAADLPVAVMQPAVSSASALLQTPPPFATDGYVGGSAAIVHDHPPEPLADPHPAPVEESSLAQAFASAPLSDDALHAGTISTAVENTPPADIRWVMGSRVNMRDGPGTNHNVLATLTRGQEVELLGESSGNWVKLRVIETDRIGWMSSRLLARSN